MLAAPLMEWYLQTRTNTPINYKTILVLQASRASCSLEADLPASIASSRIRSNRRSSTTVGAFPFSTSTTNFWSPAFPCNLENDPAEPRASQIFDTRGAEEEKDTGLSASEHAERMTNSAFGMETEIGGQKDDAAVNRGSGTLQRC